MSEFEPVVIHSAHPPFTKSIYAPVNSGQTLGRCRECARRDVPLVGGILTAHQAIRADSGPMCPGAGNAPDNDVQPGRYEPRSQFASCPAASGEPYKAAPAPGCPQFPDGAHRCGQDRGTHLIHECTCHFTWKTSPAL